MFRPTSRAPGSAHGQKFQVLEILRMFSCSFYRATVVSAESVYQISSFSIWELLNLDHIFPSVMGPWLRLCIRPFTIFFWFSFRATVIRIPNFTLLRYREVL